MLFDGGSTVAGVKEECDDGGITVGCSSCLIQPRWWCEAKQF